MKYVLLGICVSISVCIYSQTKALFLGNSYTNYNNLPQMVSDLAANGGYELLVDQNTPGGYTLNGHSTNSTSQAKIQQGDWDFVVLQEQSQLPSFPEWQYLSESFYFAENLNDQILESNPCAETMFYMTWGRENGDASNCEFIPEVCTYEGMDDLLADRYVYMAEELDGVVSPVGKVWRYLRDNNSEIDLYASDGSHPSLAGSYAAAVTFYSAIFRADPTLLTENLGVPEEAATEIKQAVQAVVFNDLEEHFIGSYDLSASFEAEAFYPEDLTMEFVSTSENATSFSWIVNGEEYDTESISVLVENGEAAVSLTVSNGCETLTTDVFYYDFINSVSELDLNEIITFPNPVLDILNLKEAVDYLLIKEASGRSVIEVNEFTYQVDVSGLKSGSYFLKVRKGDKLSTLKFMKY